MPQGDTQLQPGWPSPGFDAGSQTLGSEPPSASNWDDWLLTGPAGTGAQGLEPIGQTDRATGPLPITHDGPGLPWQAQADQQAAPQVDTGPLSLLKMGQSVSLNQRDWQVLRRLGKDSGESQVYLIEGIVKPDAQAGTATSGLAVLKYYFPGYRPKLEVLDALMRVRHPGLLRILEAGYYRGQCFEILEYASGGDLLQSAPIQDPELLRRIVSETSAALDVCHRAQIVHRDIKPDNLFFETEARTRVMIGDFGISSKISDDAMHHLTSQSRTPIYAAPEVYQSIAGQTVIQPEVDYYSLGVTLLYLWTGRNPFSGLNEFQIMQAKLQSRLTPPADMPEPLSRLIRGLLTVRTDKRWGRPEIERWLSGETVAVYDAPTQTQTPFKFATDPAGEPLLADSPAELAHLLRRDPARGLAFLQSGAIRKWLELLGEHDMALGIEALSGRRAHIGPAVQLLDPRLPLAFSGGDISDPAELATRVYAGNWDAEGWPEGYKQALDALASGSLQAWLTAQGRGELVARWARGSVLGIDAAAPRDLERLLRLLDPGLAPVRLEIDASGLRPPQGLLPGEMRKFELSYVTHGPGVPRAELLFGRTGQTRQTRVINTRQGKLSLNVGTPDDRAYGRYRLGLELVPDAETAVETTRWELPYKVRYPWAKTGRSLMIAGVGGAAIGLTLRGAISYKYPKPLKAYFGTGLAPAKAAAFKDPYLDYVLCGWVIAGLIMLNLLVRMR